MKTSYKEILAEMMKTYEEKTGTCVIADSLREKKLQAYASELYALSCYGDFILKQAFVQTASGEYLDRHGELRDCKRKLGTKAKGNLTFGISEASKNDIVIEKGTVCSKAENPLIQYVTDETVTLKSGNRSVDVSATAIENGEKFNADCDEIRILVNAPVGVEYVFNIQRFDGGSDDEGDSSFRKRIIDSFKIPLNYFNKESIELEIKNIDDYNDCFIKPSDNASEVNVVISSARNLTDDDLQKVKNIFPQAELFGVNVNLVAAGKSYFSVSAKVKMKYVDNEENARQEIYDNLNEILARNKINYNITLDELKKAVFAVDGVESVEIISDRMLKDEIICENDCYLILKNLEVEVYEN